MSGAHLHAGHHPLHPLVSALGNLAEALGISHELPRLFGCGEGKKNDRVNGGEGKNMGKMRARVRAAAHTRRVKRIDLEELLHRIALVCIYGAVLIYQRPYALWRRRRAQRVGFWRPAAGAAICGRLLHTKGRRSSEGRAHRLGVGLELVVVHGGGRRASSMRMSREDGRRRGGQRCRRQRRCLLFLVGGTVAESERQVAGWCNSRQTG